MRHKGKKVVFAAAVLICVLAFAVELSAQTVPGRATAPRAARATSVTIATPTLEVPGRKDNSGSVLPDDLRTKEDYDVGRPDLGEGENVQKVSILRVFLSLLVVIVLIVGVVYVLRIFWAKGMRLDVKGHHIRVIDMVNLGMTRTLFLVEVGEKLMLLGSTDKGLALISEITDRSKIEQTPGSLESKGGVAFQGEFESAVIEAARSEGGMEPDKASTFAQSLKNKLSKLEEENK